MSRFLTWWRSWSVPGLFSWVNPIIHTAMSGRPLNEEEVRSWLEADYPEKGGGIDVPKAAEDGIQRLQKGETLIQVLVADSKQKFLRSAALYTVYIFCQLSLPWVLRQLIFDIQGEKSRGVYFALALGIIAGTGGLFNQHHMHLVYRIGARLRALTTALVYRKMLTLSSADIGEADRRHVADVNNLVSNDCQKFLDLLPILNLVWGSPVLIIGATASLLVILGPSSLAGIGVLCTMVFLNFILTKKIGSYRQRHLPLIDARVRVSSEVCHGMRSVKLNGWEGFFRNKILSSRDQELPWIKRELIVFALQVAFTIVIPQIATLVTFVAFTIGEGEVLDATKSFSALLLFNILRFPIMFLADVLTLLIQSSVSIRRLSRFLEIESSSSHKSMSSAASRSDDAPDKSSSTSSAKAFPNGVDEKKSETNGGEKLVGNGKLDESCASTTALFELNDAKFWWEERIESAVADKIEDEEEEDALSSQRPSSPKVMPDDGGKLVLEHINIHIEPGQFVCIVGSVGSGKSTLLAGLLNECRTKGVTTCRGTHGLKNSMIGYCPQQAWVLNASLRDNILFGLPFEEEKYREVLTACCLWPDLDQLPSNDMTMIGEKGVTISGGQKQRVALARIAYAKPPTIFLDDVLSALDGDTGSRVYDQLIGPEGYLCHSTRVLVTHAVNILPDADQVVVLKRGGALFAGPYATLQKEAEVLERAMSSMGPQESQDDQSELRREDSRILRSLSCFRVKSAGTMRSNPDLKSLVSLIRSASNNKLGAKAGSLMTQEDKEQGVIGWSTAWFWFTSGGGYFFILIELAFFLFERISYLGADVWLSTWTSAADDEPEGFFARWFDLPKVDSDNNPRSDSRTYAIGYTILILSNAVFATARTFWWVRGGWTATIRLFSRMLSSILRSPMAFFETTPTGRIINRLTYDVEVCDFSLVVKGLQSCASMFWLLSALIIIIGVVPWTGIGIAVVLAVYSRIHHLYMTSAAQLQRLVSTTRSPVLSHIQESSAGGPIIRAMGSETTNRFVERSDETVTTATEAFLAFAAVGRWLGIRLELIGATVITVTSFSAWLLREELTGSTAGLAVIWSFNFTITLGFLVLSTTEVEAKAVSVERIKAYSNLPSERPLFLGDDESHESKSTSKNWPHKGVIAFENATFAYREGLPPAVRDLSFKVNAAEHVGVVGRTGAGKSTIASAIFRLRELVSGKIVVDGEDLSMLGLQDVRGGKIAIIPQDPVLFSGSIRSNLDPMDEHSDGDIWDALRAVQMDIVVEKSPELLEQAVAEGGRNFSVGERQLLCFARALLRKPKIMVLDEATANVDNMTDEKIQETLRTAFSSTTLLTIAHRLHTVMDYNRIIVLDRGSIAEIGTPADLLADSTSHLSSLVDSLGPEAASQLRQIAQRGKMGQDSRLSRVE